jgi:hypothetical protein
LAPRGVADAPAGGLDHPPGLALVAALARLIQHQLPNALPVADF